ncbi:MAG: XrtA/PEP-CTERM system TPR-repeat protein PrsT [Betaproteobacteria bacterium]
MSVKGIQMRTVIRKLASAGFVAVALLAGCGADDPASLVESAKSYLAKNDRDAAVIQLKNALQKSPDLAEARFLLGRTLLESGDLAAAEKELRRASELKYPFDQVAPSLARVMVLRGANKKVLDEFAKAEVTSPQSKASLQSSIGHAWFATGDAKAASGAFDAALAAVPGFPPALLGQARLKASEGDAAGALALADAAVAKVPTYIDAWQFKGDLAGGMGQFDEAMAAYRKALEIRPANAAAHARVVALLLRQGKSEAANEQLEAMKKVAPRNPQTLYLQALVNFRAKNYAAARDAIQQQLRAAPDNSLGLVLSAAIDFHTGSYAQAEASLQKVLQRAPREKFARTMLVNTYLRTGQPARALDALKPLLPTFDTDSDVLALAGEVYVQNGDTAQAGSYFAKAAALDPKNPDKRTVLAMLRISAGDGEHGFRELQDIAAVDSGIRADMALIAINTRQGKFDAALGAIAALEKKMPDKPLPNDLRGAVLMSKGDLAGARKSFERAVALDPADFTAATNLAKLDVADKKPADASKRFEGILAKDPKNVQALIALAELRLRAAAPPDDVVGLIGKAIAADPTNAAARLALVTYYVGAKQPGKAVAAAQDALAAMPDRAELLYALGQAQQAAGEPNQAIKSYNKLAQARPGSPVPYLKEAEAQIASKDYDAALQNLKKAIALKPDSLEAQRAIIGIYLAKGGVAEALTVARTVQKQRQKEPIGYVMEGDIHALQKAWKEAADAYRKGLANVAATELAAKNVAALRAAGNTAEADKFASTWIKSHPTDREFRSFLAESALVKGDFAAAAQQYKAMLEDRPDDAVWLNNLAWASGQLKDPKAIEYAEKANKLVPNNAAILDTLGVLQVDKGEVKRGIESLQKATALAPNAPGVRLNLARALIKDGQKDAARKELEVLAKLGDKFSGAAEVTKLMQGL